MPKNSFARQFEKAVRNGEIVIPGTFGTRTIEGQVSIMSNGTRFITEDSNTWLIFDTSYFDQFPVSISGIIDWSDRSTENATIIGAGDLSGLGPSFGKYAAIVGVLGNDLTTSTGATAYSVRAQSDNYVYIEHEAISRHSGGANMFHASLGYADGDISSTFASILKSGSTANAAVYVGSGVEASGTLPGDAVTQVHAFTDLGTATLNLTAGVFGSGGNSKITLTEGNINISNIPTFADDSAAGAGGLTTGDIYITTSDNKLTVKT